MKHLRRVIQILPVISLIGCGDPQAAVGDDSSRSTSIRQEVNIPDARGQLHKGTVVATSAEAMPLPSQLAHVRAIMAGESGAPDRDPTRPFPGYSERVEQAIQELESISDGADNSHISFVFEDAAVVGVEAELGAFAHPPISHVPVPVASETDQTLNMFVTQSTPTANSSPTLSCNVGAAASGTTVVCAPAPGASALIKLMRNGSAVRSVAITCPQATWTLPIWLASGTAYSVQLAITSGGVHDDVDITGTLQCFN